MNFSKDGSFRFEEATPGDYRFYIRILEPRYSTPAAFAHPIAEFTEKFTIPEGEKSNSREALDIGTFEISLKPGLAKVKGESPDQGRLGGSVWFRHFKTEAQKRGGGKFGRASERGT